MLKKNQNTCNKLQYVGLQKHYSDNFAFFFKIAEINPKQK